MIKARETRHPLIIPLAIVAIGLTAIGAQAATISLINTGFLDNTANQTSYSTSFDASLSGNPVDKLIVAAMTESAVAISGITYNGVAMTLIPATAGSRNSGTWYLDAPYSGGAANIVVSGNGVTTFSHMRLGIASIAGSATGFDAANRDGASTSVSLNVLTDRSFVLAGFGANLQATPTAASPLRNIFGVNSDSAAASAGLVLNVSSGTNNYSFTGNTTSPETTAAAFAPANDGRLPILDLFTTGVGTNRTSLANNTIGDPHYTLTSVPSGSNSIRVRTSAGGGPIPPWIGDSLGSAWIGPNNDAGLNSPPGNYTAQTTFTIPVAADLSTVVIAGSWAVDNNGLDILLNGNSLVASGHISAGEISGGFGSFTTFSFGPGVPYFSYGANTLSFVWNNTGVSANPTGLRVGYLVGSYLETVLVPAPAALPAGLAVLALAAMRRRR